MLRTSIAEFLAREAAPTTITRVFRERRGYDPALYRRVAELGWLGILVPEHLGGAGLGIREAALAFEAFGQGPLPGPYFSSSVLAVILLLEGGSEAQHARYLPRIADGTLRASLAAMDSGLGWGADLVTSRLAGDEHGGTLTGEKPFVQDGLPADLLLCLARDDAAAGAISLVLVDAASPGVSIEPRPGLLASVAGVRLAGVSIGRDQLLGARGAGWELVERAVALSTPVLCSFMVGGCRRILDFTVQYTRDRWAFGQPIGRFQRVQDHVVELVNHTDAASLLTAELLARTGAGEDVRALTHEARAVATEGYYQACNYSHMVHAGPGTDLDHPLVAHTVMSRTLYQYLGDPAYHKRRMMDVLYPAEGLLDR
jgi:acyl-CoA dehydrogenase